MSNKKGRKVTAADKNPLMAVLYVSVVLPALFTVSPWLLALLALLFVAADYYVGPPNPEDTEKY